MAENEILDVGGRRWQRSRAALALPNLSRTAVAECIADDLNRGLQLQLRKAFQAGQTLLDVLRAAEGNSAASRAAVQSFQDRGLAQIIQNAIKIAGSREPSVVANCAADILLKAVQDLTVGLAGRSEAYQDYAQRQALSKAIEAELQACRSGVVANIEASLRGHSAMRLRRSGNQQPSAPKTAAALVNVSLGIRPNAVADEARHG